MKKISLGDVFEIETPQGLGYFQCVQIEAPNEPETIRVFPGVYGTRPNIDVIVKRRELYFVQFPLRHALRLAIVNSVGNFPIPSDITLPKYVRAKHVVKGQFISWHIIDTETLMIDSVKDLTDEQRRLSPAGVWNDTLLAERIATNWKPEDWV